MGWCWFVGKGIPVLNWRLWGCVPGVVDGVRGQFISTMETVVRVDGFDVESEQFSLLVCDDEG